MEPSNTQPLSEFLKTKPQVWEGIYLEDTYRRIIRDIIHIFAELERYIVKCTLDLKHLIIADNEVQRDFQNYGNKSEQGLLCKLQCKSVIEKILGKDDTKRELTHFYEMAQIQGVTLADLWHHPLLMTCTRRYSFPQLALIELMRVGNWETDYANYTENHIPSYRKKNIKTTIQSASEYQQTFLSIYHNTYDQEGCYQNYSVGVLTFSKNVEVHIGENLARTQQNSLAMHEVEQHLTSLFPERLTELYGFFVVKKKISMSCLLRSRVEFDTAS